MLSPKNWVSTIVKVAKFTPHVQYHMTCAYCAPPHQTTCNNSLIPNYLFTIQLFGATM